MSAREEARKLLAEVSPVGWRVEALLGRARRVLSADGLPVAFGVTTPANALLIAAAPRLLAALCAELDAAEKGVRWEDVDLDTVTAIEDRDGHVWCQIVRQPDDDEDRPFECDDALLGRERLLEMGPVWFRDAGGWHKVAQQ